MRAMCESEMSGFRVRVKSSVSVRVRMTSWGVIWGVHVGHGTWLGAVGYENMRVWDLGSTLQRLHASSFEHTSMCRALGYGAWDPHRREFTTPAYTQVPENTGMYGCMGVWLHSGLVRFC